MKNIIKYAFGAVALSIGLTLGSCSDFEPTGYEALPELPVVSNLKAEVEGHNINVTWQLPSSEGITGLRFIKNADNSNPIELPANATSYVVKGQPMGEEGLFTVKVCYDNKYVSEGVTATAVLPVETLTGVSNLTAAVSGRTVTLKWTNPTGADITGVRIIRNGDAGAAIELPAGTTSYELKAQPMDVQLTYSVELIYDEYYTSTAATTQVKVPYIAPKIAYLLLADKWQNLPDDDERAAAEWFASQENAEFVAPAQLADLDVDLYPVVWIEIDRVGLPLGWQNLPSEVSGDPSIAALKAYPPNGATFICRIWPRSSQCRWDSYPTIWLPVFTAMVKAAQAPMYGLSMHISDGISAMAPTRVSMIAQHMPFTMASRSKTPTDMATMHCRLSVRASEKTTTAYGTATSTAAATIPT